MFGWPRRFDIYPPLRVGNGLIAITPLNRVPVLPLRFPKQRQRHVSMCHDTHMSLVGCSGVLGGMSPLLLVLMCQAANDTQHLARFPAAD
jgi:hypothetical protein